MGRWRPPGKPSSPYITAAGARILRAELDQLWRVERPEVVRALAAAAAEGDRSENAEYIYRKKQLAGLDRRIRYLNKRLGSVQVVAARPADQSTARFGAWVTLEADEPGPAGAETTQCLRIVGADETDAGQGWISVDSPMARALLGRNVGDEVVVHTPEGRRIWWVVAIDYKDDPRDANGGGSVTPGADMQDA